MMSKVNNMEYKCVKKYSPNEKREVLKAFEKLKEMITIKEQYGVPFEKYLITM